MIDPAGTCPAGPSAEISQRLSHIIGSFPGMSLPMLPPICVTALKSSYVYKAISHPPLTCPHGHLGHRGQLSATEAWMCTLPSGSSLKRLL